ncbi:MAG: hypothetical protein JW822_12895 [Spirochaetales bacterium]|nr:hypothetical protein [Spirochaetales bacterium]
MCRTRYNRCIVGMSLMILLFQFIAGCEQEEVMENPWEVIIDTQVKQPVRMAAFLDESFGITGGFSGAGKTNRTLDGGKTWNISEASGGCLFGIEIIDSNTVWVAGKMSGMSFDTPGGLRLSKDGGLTFEESATIRTLPRECPMSFMDENSGWFYQNEKLRRTADGGKNWKETALPVDAAIIKAVQLRTKTDGYLLDITGNLFTTNDGGNTWSKTQLPLQKYHCLEIMEFESVAAAIRFFDKNNGVVVASLLAEGERKDCVLAFRTKDGGQNWRSELVSYGCGIIFLSPDGRYVTIQLMGKIAVLRYTGEEWTNL